MFVWCVVGIAKYLPRMTSVISDHNPHTGHPSSCPTFGERQTPVTATNAVFTSACPLECGVYKLQTKKRT